MLPDIGGARADAPAEWLPAVSGRGQRRIPATSASTWEFRRRAFGAIRITPENALTSGKDGDTVDEASSKGSDRISGRQVNRS